MGQNARRKITDRTEVVNQIAIGEVEIAAVTQSGTWTVQPGNTPNTSPWLTDTRRGQTLLFAPVTTASSGDLTVVAADATKKIKVISYTLVSTSANSLTWKSASTALSGAMALAANGTLSASGHPTAWLMQTAVNEALILNLSGATQVSGHVAYFLEA